MAAAAARRELGYARVSWIFLALALAALAVVLGHIALFGVVREADEGAAAHIWQLLMAGQAPGAS